MKKVLTLILAALLIVSLLPLSALADEAAPLPTDEAKVKVYYGAKKSFTLTLKADTGAAYVAVNEDGTYGKWTGEEAPADKYVKFEYVAGEPGTVKATFNNFVIDSTPAGEGAYTAHTIEFLTGAIYNVEIELIGENAITQKKSACIKYSNEGTMTISGAGSLTLTLNGAASGALWGNGGDLFIKDTTVNLMVDPGESNNSAHHGIFMAKGSVTLENVKSTSTARGGSMVYIGTTDKEAGGGNGSGRSTPSKDVNRTITVKNCDITCTTRTGATFLSAGPAKISGSTLKLTKNSASGKNIFVPAPVFEGDFSAIAGLAKNAEKLDKLKYYQEGKLGSYTYIYAVPGVVELLPTEPTTEPPAETDPVETQPVETQPVETKPVETKPVETQPKETQPATQPAPTEPAEGDEEGLPLTTILIIVIAAIVVAAAAVVVLFLLKKKGIIK